ncbi:MAG TPA: hypothetical protein VFT45_06105 [Longimicrobium sp.]|nr:hypothetical protein [Longimicrobium sp.]
MPVVVNDFEVVADAPAKRGSGEGGESADAGAGEELDPGEVAVVLRALNVAALRTWAH